MSLFTAGLFIECIYLILDAKTQVEINTNDVVFLPLAASHSDSSSVTSVASCLLLRLTESNCDPERCSWSSQAGSWRADGVFFPVTPSGILVGGTGFSAAAKRGGSFFINLSY